ALPVSEGINGRRPAPPSLHAKEHTLYKGVDRGLTGFVLTLEELYAVSQQDGPVSEFPEMSQFQLLNFHSVPLLVSMRALTPSKSALYSTLSFSAPEKLSMYLPIRLYLLFLYSFSMSQAAVVSLVLSVILD